MSLIVNVLFLAFAAIGGALVLLLALSPLSHRLLPRGGRKELEGIATIEDAARAGRATGLAGLELVAWAQGMAARRFEYSRRNPWDSPARAFERGMGYCWQQASALKLVYDALGIESRTVQAFPCSFPPKEIHGRMSRGGLLGHVWLRVRAGSEWLNVCCGSVDNSPGKIHFRIIGRVKDLEGPAALFAHLGSVAVNVALDLPAVLGLRA
jgi:hypothetical protein